LVELGQQVLMEILLGMDQVEMGEKIEMEKVVI